MAKRWKFIRSFLDSVNIEEFNANVNILNIYDNGNIRYLYNGEINTAIFDPNTDTWSITSDVNFLSFTVTLPSLGSESFTIDNDTKNITYVVENFVSLQELIAGYGYVIPMEINYDLNKPAKTTYLSNSATTTPTEISSGDTVNWLLYYDDITYYYHLRDFKLNTINYDVTIEFLKPSDFLRWITGSGNTGTTELTSGVSGETYHETIYFWRNPTGLTVALSGDSYVYSGDLPDNINISGKMGSDGRYTTISLGGVPTHLGTFTFTLKLYSTENPNDVHIEKTFSITIE